MKDEAQRPAALVKQIETLRRELEALEDLATDPRRSGGPGVDPELMVQLEELEGRLEHLQSNRYLAAHRMSAANGVPESLIERLLERFSSRSLEAATPSPSQQNSITGANRSWLPDVAGRIHSQAQGALAKPSESGVGNTVSHLERLASKMSVMKNLTQGGASSAQGAGIAALEHYALEQAERTGELRPVSGPLSAAKGLYGRSLPHYEAAVSALEAGEVSPTDAKRARRAVMQGESRLNRSLETSGYDPETRKGVLGEVGSQREALDVRSRAGEKLHGSRSEVQGIRDALEQFTELQAAAQEAKAMGMNREAAGFTGQAGRVASKLPAQLIQARGKVSQLEDGEEKGALEEDLRKLMPRSRTAVNASQTQKLLSQAAQFIESLDAGQREVERQLRQLEGGKGTPARVQSALRRQQKQLEEGRAAGLYVPHSGYEAGIQDAETRVTAHGRGQQAEKQARAFDKDAQSLKDASLALEQSLLALERGESGGSPARVRQAANRLESAVTRSKRTEGPFDPSAYQQQAVEGRDYADSVDGKARAQKAQGRQDAAARAQEKRDRAQQKSDYGELFKEADARDKKAETQGKSYADHVRGLGEASTALEEALLGLHEGKVTPAAVRQAARRLEVKLRDSQDAQAPLDPSAYGNQVGEARGFADRTETQQTASTASSKAQDAARKAQEKQDKHDRATRAAQYGALFDLEERASSFEGDLEKRQARMGRKSGEYAEARRSANDPRGAERLERGSVNDAESILNRIAEQGEDMVDELRQNGQETRARALEGKMAGAESSARAQVSRFADPGGIGGRLAGGLRDVPIVGDLLHDTLGKPLARGINGLVTQMEMGFAAATRGRAFGAAFAATPMGARVAAGAARMGAAAGGMAEGVGAAAGAVMTNPITAAIAVVGAVLGGGALVASMKANSDYGKGSQARDEEKRYGNLGNRLGSSDRILDDVRFSGRKDSNGALKNDLAKLRYGTADYASYQESQNAVGLDTQTRRSSGLTGLRIARSFNLETSQSGQLANSIYQSGSPASMRDGGLDTNLTRFAQVLKEGIKSGVGASEMGEAFTGLLSSAQNSAGGKLEQSSRDGVMGQLISASQSGNARLMGKGGAGMLQNMNETLANVQGKDVAFLNVALRGKSSKDLGFEGKDAQIYDNLRKRSPYEATQFAAGVQTPEVRRLQMDQVIKTSDGSITGLIENLSRQGMGKQSARYAAMELDSQRDSSGHIVKGARSSYIDAFVSKIDKSKLDQDPLKESQEDNKNYGVAGRQDLNKQEIAIRDSRLVFQSPINQMNIQSVQSFAMGLNAAKQAAQDQFYKTPGVQQLEEGGRQNLINGRKFDAPDPNGLLGNGAMTNRINSLANQAQQNAASRPSSPMPFGFAGTGFGLPRFAAGGFVGDGAKTEAKGVVEGGEYVFDKESTQRLRPLLEQLHKGELPRHAMGGMAGTGMRNLPEGASSSAGPMPVGALGTGMNVYPAPSRRDGTDKGVETELARVARTLEENGPGYKGLGDRLRELAQILVALNPTLALGLRGVGGQKDAAQKGGTQDGDSSGTPTPSPGVQDLTKASLRVTPSGSSSSSADPALMGAPGQNDTRGLKIAGMANVAVDASWGEEIAGYCSKLARQVFEKSEGRALSGVLFGRNAIETGQMFKERGLTQTLAETKKNGGLKAGDALIQMSGSVVDGEEQGHIGIYDGKGGVVENSTRKGKNSRHGRGGKMVTPLSEFGNIDLVGRVGLDLDGDYRSSPAERARALSKGAGSPRGVTSQTRGVGADSLVTAIAAQESGHRYDVVNSSTGALGKYQVMPQNLDGSWNGKKGKKNFGWDYDALGRDVTPQEYLKSPDLQEKIAQSRIRKEYGKQVSQGHSPQDAASRTARVWYSDNPESSDKPAPGNYPSPNQYARQVVARIPATPPTNARSSASLVRPGVGAGSSGERGSSGTQRHEVHFSGNIQLNGKDDPKITAAASEQLAKGMRTGRVKIPGIQSSRPGA